MIRVHYSKKQMLALFQKVNPRIEGYKSRDQEMYFISKTGQESLFPMMWQYILPEPLCYHAKLRKGGDVVVAIKDGQVTLEAFREFCKLRRDHNITGLREWAEKMEWEITKGLKP